ncbi:hypothetical protein MKQ70_35735 [Chitinophaga sedimenti]|uniref:hypothetical protein n=1 Tax=Chitinophaga sedimenti TaxID=2033606 RepID=UPI002003B17A|nr:hypothetical protein [Chitinophaga sedimenti]MCK7559990.1 hypothetical protein [Chitinophaga sedimenti]
MLLYLGIAASVILLFIILYVIRKRHHQEEGTDYIQRQLERFAPLLDKLKNNEPIAEQDVLPYAENIATRQALYELLRDTGRLSLFPAAYNTIRYSAESQLATWLEFPMALGAAPDEITYLERVPVSDASQTDIIYYEVFKYRVHPPKKGSQAGWILGVVGPFTSDSKPYDLGRATYSRPDDNGEPLSPEALTQWVHDNIAKHNE